MEKYSAAEMARALEALASMIARGEKMRGKFAPGTAQHTLQMNRTHALQTAMALIENAMGDNDAPVNFSREELEKARAPIESLISKSEKARTKLREGTWQHSMLGENLDALHIAAACLTATFSLYY